MSHSVAPYDFSYDFKISMRVIFLSRVNKIAGIIFLIKTVIWSYIYY